MQDNPRIDTLIKLPAALEIGASDLLAGIGWEPGGTRPGCFQASASESRVG